MYPFLHLWGGTTYFPLFLDMLSLKQSCMFIESDFLPFQAMMQIENTEAKVYIVTSDS